MYKISVNIRNTLILYQYKKPNLL